MGILSQYKDATKGLYDEVGGSSKNRIYFDCEMQAVIEIQAVKLGVSKNPKRKGTPFCGADFTVVEIQKRGVNSDVSMIDEGDEVSYHKWLPRFADADAMTLRDKYNLAEVIGLFAAAANLQKEYMDLDTAEAMAKDDGKRIKGRKVGVRVEASLMTDDKDNPVLDDAGRKRYYFNPKFYPIDANGKEVDGRTPDEVSG